MTSPDIDSHLQQARCLDAELREGAEILARWCVAARLYSEPARVIEVRPHSLEVETSSGQNMVLPRAHSVRWSPGLGAFPLEMQYAEA